MKHASTKEVRTWLLWIMSRLPSNESDQEAAAKAQMMAAGLSQSYPLQAFTEASANYVLIDLQVFREADIRQRLNKWRQIHLPDVSSLPEEAANAPVDDDGRNWIARWLRSQTDSDARATLALIKSYHRAAFTHLMKTDIRAASLALRYGWPDPSIDRTTEWADPEVVERAIQSCFGFYLDGSIADPSPLEISTALRTLRSLLTKFAPQNLHLLPSGEATGGSDNGTDRGGPGEDPRTVGGETRLHG